MRISPLVLQVAPLDHSKIGGVSYSPIELSAALHRSNTRVVLISSIPCVPSDFKCDFQFLALQDVRGGSMKGITEVTGKPDLVVFHSTYIPAQARLASETFQSGIPYLIVPRGGMTIGAQRSKRFKKIIGNLLFFSAMVRRCLAIHCLNAGEAKEVSLWGRPVFISPNGIYRPDKSLRTSRPIGPSIRFLYLGRIDILHKGMDRMLKAVQCESHLFRQTGSSLSITGPASDPDSKRLLRMITDLGLEDIVHFRDALRGPEKSRAFFESDCFVYFSRWEGHPISVLEALAHGVPCILTPETNVSSLVQERGAGWELGGSPSSLALGLRRVMENPAQLAEMGKAARRLAYTEFDWDSIAQKLGTVYRELLNRQ